MSKLEAFFNEKYPDSPSLSKDIDTFEDLKPFSKLKHLDLKQTLSLIEEDLGRNPADILPYLFYLKSLISIFGLQFVFLLLKQPNFLRNLQIRADSQTQNKLISLTFLQIVQMISEKTRSLSESELDFDELKGITQFKMLLRSQSKLPKFTALSAFDETYIQTLLIHKKAELFLQGRKGMSLPDFRKELDSCQSMIMLALSDRPSASEKDLARELTLKNQALIEKLNDNKPPEQAKSKKDPLALRTSFTIHESLPLENMEIEYKNYFMPFNVDQKFKLQNCICAFLNTNGGRIFLGVKDLGNEVCGLKLNPEKRKMLLRDLDEIYEGIIPELDQKQLIKIYFLPVLNDFQKVISSLFVVKIVVKQGGKTIYANSQNKAFKRRDGKVKMLSPEEMKQELIKKHENDNIFISEDDFNDPEPPFEYLNQYSYNQNYNYNNYKDKEKIYVRKETQNTQVNPKPIDIIESEKPAFEQKQQPAFEPKQLAFEEKQQGFEAPKKIAFEPKSLDLKIFNPYVIQIKVKGELTKQDFKQAIIDIKNFLTKILELKINKTIFRTDKKLIFIRFDSELKMDLNQLKDFLIDNAFQTILELSVDFAKRGKIEKYEKELVLIK